MRFSCDVRRFGMFAHSKRKPKRLAFRNLPGFIGFYGRVPFTRNVMLSLGLTTT